MKTEELFAIISGYADVVENCPIPESYNYTEDDPDFDFEDITDTVWSGMHQLINALLRTASFAFVFDRDGSFIKIFGTAEERDRFVTNVVENEARRKTEHPETVKSSADLEERIESGEVICAAIDFKQFMEYAQGSEVVLPYYSFDKVDNSIVFEHLGCVRIG